MELLQLRYFMIVAKYENMSKAAKELFIAQPAVSQSIARLEKELGLELFVREGKKIQLNEAGKKLQKKIPKLMKAYEEIEWEMKQFAQNQKKLITINLKASSDRMSDLILAYQKEHPEIEFHLLQGTKDTDSQGSYDIKISSTKDGQGQEVLLREEIGLMIPLSLFQGKGNCISLNQVRDLPFVGLEKSSQLRKMSDDFCEQIGIMPKYVIESDSPAFVRKVLEAGSGIAFFPSYTWKQPNCDRLRFFHIQEGPLERCITMDLSETARKKDYVSDFCNYVRNTLVSSINKAIE
ncbi:MAG: LysR family transcriptional regulator [Vallitaleaceae bacterium]|nr:LysR family transcriptional regulator [Vallitaleaceae bacterium]